MRVFSPRLVEHMYMDIFTSTIAPQNEINYTLQNDKSILVKILRFMRDKRFRNYYSIVESQLISHFQSQYRLQCTLSSTAKGAVP